MKKLTMTNYIHLKSWAPFLYSLQTTATSVINYSNIKTNSLSNTQICLMSCTIQLWEIYKKWINQEVSKYFVTALWMYVYSYDKHILGSLDWLVIHESGKLKNAVVGEGLGKISFWERIIQLKHNWSFFES